MGTQPRPPLHASAARCSVPTGKRAVLPNSGSHCFTCNLRDNRTELLRLGESLMKPPPKLLSAVFLRVGLRHQSLSLCRRNRLHPFAPLPLTHVSLHKRHLHSTRPCRLTVCTQTCPFLWVLWAQVQRQLWVCGKLAELCYR